MTTMQAVFNGAVVAESDATVVVEGNHYFPVDSVRSEFLAPSDTHTVCAWKGKASYYDVKVGGETAKDGAWYYPRPSDAAKSITDRVAFWKGVSVRAGEPGPDPESLDAPEGSYC